MTLMEHLAELRERLIKSFIALAVGAVIGLALSEQILKFLLSPYGPQSSCWSPTRFRH